MSRTLSPLDILRNKSPKNILRQSLENKNLIAQMQTRNVEGVDLTEFSQEGGQVLGETITPFPVPNSVYLRPYASDFIGTNEDFTFEAIGAGSFLRGTDDAAGHYGIMIVTQSGANTGALARLATTTLTKPLIYPESVFECIFKCPSSNSAIVIQGGFMDSLTQADSTDGIYFEVTFVGARMSISLIRLAAGVKTNTTARLIGVSYDDWMKARITIDVNGEASLGASNRLDTLDTTPDTLDVSGAIGLTAMPMIKAFKTSAGSIDIAYFDYAAVWSNAVIRW